MQIVCCCYRELKVLLKRFNILCLCGKFAEAKREIETLRTRRRWTEEQKQSIADAESCIAKHFADEARVRKQIAVLGTLAAHKRWHDFAAEI